MQDTLGEIARADARSTANIVNLANVSAVGEMKVRVHRVVDVQKIAGHIIPELKRVRRAALNSPHPGDERRNQVLLRLTGTRLVEASRTDDANARAHRELK